MTANKPMTGEQLDELMTVAVNMQRDAETDCNRPSAMFAYAVQVAVLELRKVRNDSVELEQKLADSQREFRAADATIENLQMQVEKLAAENAGLKKFVTQECHIAHVEPETFYEEEITRYVNADGYEPETPSTDAFLAEVRANVITDALKSLDGVFDTDCVMESKGISYEDAEQRTAGAYAVTKALEEFAAQLRKGVQS
ncbi:hypothetical protein [Enterobacter roggenkampii]|uniref:hypothetical protein n=1 Tax=Enterobacter roggenkampii TaxID=1812935 RepID=UPI0035D48CAC